MKNFLSIILIIVLSVSALCACSSPDSDSDSETSSVISLDDAIRNDVRREAMSKYNIAVVKEVMIGYTENVGEDQYTASGKIVVIDKYGDIYSGNWDADVTYDKETGNSSSEIVFDRITKD